MASISTESLYYTDDLIGGVDVNLITANIPVSAGTAIARGSVISVDGALVTASTTAYGVVASAVSATDTVATVYTAGQFNRDKLIVGSDTTVAAHEQELRNAGIFLTAQK